MCTQIPSRWFFFLLCSLFLCRATPSQERYHPISEAELSRVEQLSEAQARQSTQALTSIKALEATLQRLSARQATLTPLLKQAQTLIAKYKESYARYVSASASIIAVDEKALAVEKAKTVLWRNIALAAIALIAVYITLRVFFARLKIP